jgi:anaerobic selenocysteine-containing dehydrogenase
MHDPIADPWGPPTPIGRGEEWPERVDVHLAEGIAEDEVERWVQTASLLHSDGDAMDIAVAGGRIAGVRGRAVDRVNRGRLGPKDLFAWQANASPDRLTRPLVAGRPVSWDQAMGTVAERCRGSWRSAVRPGWPSPRPASCSPRSTGRWRRSRARASAPRTSTATRGCARRRRASR